MDKWWSMMSAISRVLMLHTLVTLDLSWLETVWESVRIQVALQEFGVAQIQRVNVGIIIGTLIYHNGNNYWYYLSPAVNCGSPPEPANSIVQSTTTNFGSTAVYSCELGYDLSTGGATFTRRCLETEEWSGATPTCDSKITLLQLARKIGGSSVFYSKCKGSQLSQWLLAQAYMYWHSCLSSMPCVVTCYGWSGLQSIDINIC